MQDLIIDNNFINNTYENKKILFEGAQGAMLDLDYGSYPFVTSSNTISSYIPIGSAINKSYETLGIFKAYATRVGNGPFPSELSNEIGDYMAEKGFEYGTVTKRKRRCGWLDLVALKYSCVANNTKELCITKVDVLNDLEEIRICKSYNGKLYDQINFASSNILENIDLDDSDFKKFKKWGDLTPMICGDQTFCFGMLRMPKTNVGPRVGNVPVSGLPWAGLGLLQGLPRQAFHAAGQHG